MNIKEFRLREGKSQKEMARLFNMSQTGYSSYETGKNQPNIEMLIKLADYFHTTVDNLIGHEVPYLLDKSTLTQRQRVILDLLPQMDDRLCENTEAYICGRLEGRKEHIEAIQKFGNKK